MAGDARRDCGLVFTSETGGPRTPANAFRDLYGIIMAANEEPGSDDDRLPRFHIYDLRHTHSMCLLMDRRDVARVARRLGHANPATTLKL